MNTTPVFIRTPKIGAVAISTANTNKDGTGTIGTVFTAGTDGSRIHRIVIEAITTTTAGMVRLYIYTGSVYFMWKEISVTAATPSATVQAFISTTELFYEDALILPTSYSLRASTHNAETFNVIAEGGDY